MSTRRDFIGGMAGVAFVGCDSCAPRTRSRPEGAGRWW